MLNKIIYYSLHNRLVVLICSLLLMIAGTYTAFHTDVDVFPDLNAPTVVIMTEANGMAPEEVERLVTFPVETAVNGAMDVRRVRSSSTTGFSVVWVEFDWGTDIYRARQIVSEKLAVVSESLPENVGKPTLGPQSSILGEMMIIGLTADDSKSGSRIAPTTQMDLRTIADWTIRPRLLSTGGVAQVAVIGGDIKEYQILLDPARMKHYGVSLGEVLAVTRNMNRNANGGVLYEYDNEYIIRGVLSTANAEEIGKGVVKIVGDFPVLLENIATVKIGSKSPKLGTASERAKPAVLITVTKQPNTSTIDLTEKLDAIMADLQKNLPADVHVSTDIFRQSRFIDSSIDNVKNSLFEGSFFVVIVLFLFLMNIRTTVISLVALPLSLLVSILTLHYMGLTINTMSLGGMAIAIGSLVDDAIVVVEGVEHIMETEKLSPYEATKKAMNGLSSALIATSLVLAAVFVPVSFLSGITGQLYRQFTVTIVVSVLISTVVALTLSPVMCSLILKPDSGKKKNIVFRKINEWLGIGSNKYVAAVTRTIKHPRRVLSAFGMVLIAILLIHRIIPTSFLPVEDQGYFKIELELPEGATLERTRVVTERAIAYLEKNPYIEYVQNVTGSSPRVGSNQGRAELTVILKPWEERKSTSIEKIMDTVEKHLREYPECKVYLSTPPVIPGLGSSGGFEMQLEARGEATFDNLVDAADTLMYYASKRKELTGLSSSLQSEIPQLYFDVDRDKVKMLGVPLADVFSTMKAYTGSVYVNDFNMFNRIYKVYIQAEAPYREHKDNINLFFVKASNGAMVPLTSLGNASYTTGPGSIKRFNMFTTAVIRGAAAQGYSSGQAMEIMEQIARDHLPDNIGLEWSGLSYQEKQAGGQTGMVMALVFLFVFLFLAAQYESWTVPIAVLLSLPVAALGAYLGVWVCGLENDVYFQIGLVMLVGLAAKNAILIVEFAKVQVDKGEDLIQSAIYAAKLRFRPILMTSLAFVLGMLPMVLASGPGSASRQAIGTGVFFGMIFAIVFGIILVPFFFVMVYKTKSKILKHKK